MGLFDFFKKKGKPAYKIETDKPSVEQIAFTEAVVEIIAPTVERFGFKLHKRETKTYSTHIVWRWDNQYIEVSSTTYPTDYPFEYNIVLGEGDSDDFFQSDWNCVAIWALARLIEPTANVSSYHFPYDEKIIDSIATANKHLLKYGESFLNGELSIFHDARKMVNEKRQPYKIYQPDKDGKYRVENEQKSAEQKKKYS